ncbi:MAG TPA: hypothetical protein VK638_50155 [Edaphobacter sp.]|nr:hypothetical protein [Edaphobacter sp.]
MRQSIAKLRWIAAALAGILLAGAWVGSGRVDAPIVSAAQNSQSPYLPPLPPPFGNGPPIGVNNNPTHKQIERVQNAERQKKLARDTDKLLTMAQQLKEEVDKSNGSTLSVDIVKKAGEIEKLAKSVKSEAK